jgi:hypothetical protein
MTWNLRCGFFGVVGQFAARALRLRDGSADLGAVSHARLAAYRCATKFYDARLRAATVPAAGWRACWGDRQWRDG